MGTPEFAVGILDTIIKNNYEVVGVITAADKPAGRGQKLHHSAVKEYALANNLRLLQPVNLKDQDFLSELKSLNANLQVVVAFRMLPKVVWEIPEFGTFNLHASLLPNYRGAAPINWAIINGEKQTGVTTFFIDDKIDTGAMILSASLPISEDENAGILHDRLMELGAETVVKTLELLTQGAVATTKQEEHGDIKTAYKLNKDNCKIDWTKTASDIHNLIRGLSPYPAAWCLFSDNGQEWNVKIYDTERIEDNHNHPIGKIIASKKEVKVAVKDGFIKINTLQFPGKKKMAASELLNGLAFSEHANAS